MRYRVPQEEAWRGPITPYAQCTVRLLRVAMAPCLSATGRTKKKERKANTCARKRREEWQKKRGHMNSFIPFFLFLSFRPFSSFSSSKLFSLPRPGWISVRSSFLFFFFIVCLWSRQIALRLLTFLSPCYVRLPFFDRCFWFYHFLIRILPTTKYTQTTRKVCKLRENRRSITSKKRIDNSTMTVGINHPMKIITCRWLSWHRIHAGCLRPAFLRPLSFFILPSFDGTTNRQ